MNTTLEAVSIRQRPFLAGFWLFAAISLTLLIALPLEGLLNIEFDLGDPISLIPVSIAHIGTGYLWARSLGHRSGLPENRLMNFSGALGFSLLVVGVIGLLPESIFQRYVALFEGVGNLEFGAFFAPWFGLITGFSGLGLGLGLRKWKLGLKMFGVGFASGFLIYLAIMFTMQLFGFKVGSGRPVMLPTTFLSMWSTALVGSALFGRILARSKPN
jgi:hypothetical protein